MPVAGAGSGTHRDAVEGAITIALCGDVMLGRGIDQILAHPCDPRLYEEHMDSALDYVALAERATLVTADETFARAVIARPAYRDALRSLAA